MSEQAIAIGSLRLHPDAEKVPLPEASDLRALRDSLRENGQQDPIDATEDGVILDGRTRWSLLRELGAKTILRRLVQVPEHQQTHWIVERALARRHLTLAQKRVLNDLLRVQVIDVRPKVHKAEEMRIGYSQTDRAEKLGVERKTIQRWDDEDSLLGTNVSTRRGPTHAIDKRGRPNLVHKPEQAPRSARPTRPPRPEPLRKSRPIPYWSRQFSTWLRGARPEDKEFLRRVDREIHAALKRNGIPCEEERVS